MMKVAYILFTLLITASAVLPSNAIVTCKKEDGSITIEFKSGESCACNLDRINDQNDKNCCDVSECHDDEKVTADCHEKNEISSGDCVDTELEFLETLTSVKRVDYLSLLNTPSFYVYDNLPLVSVLGLTKPIDVGKDYCVENEIVNLSLTLKKTSVFII
ncbi:MAG: hypothetical protein NE327_09690 [Lentisphaeraceae bacterium]|nr:hypothetical protein [Lentisphaeraceae bacterium]